MPKNVKVVTSSGKLVGKEEGGVASFLGIPYAKAPIGKKRFARSEELHSNRELLCISPRGSSYQFGPNFDGDTTPNESLDCLYLNVYAPAGKKDCPVFVWIHGGGFLTGCSYYPMYNGSNYAKEGVVFVSINYRLGCFGYLDLSGEGKEFDSNCGLSDQILALKWIKANIERFGGDPSNVSVCGESAGGISLWALLSSPKCEGLFQKAIFESSLAYCFHSKATLAPYVAAFKKAAGLKEGEFAKILTLSPRRLVKMTKEALSEVKGQIIGAMTLAPIVGDDLLPYDSLEASKRGINKDVKILIGTNRDEGTLFANQFFPSEQPYGWAKNEAMFAQAGASDLFPAIKAYYSRYFSPDEAFHQLACDNLFIRGMLDNLALRKNYADCFVFRFDYSTPESRKRGFNACHALEMSFVLKTTDYTLSHLPLLQGADPREVKRMETLMSSSWLRFVKEGNPGWPSFNEGEKAKILALDPGEISYCDYAPLKLFQGRRINTH